MQETNSVSKDFLPSAPATILTGPGVTTVLARNTVTSGRFRHLQEGRLLPALRWQPLPRSRWSHFRWGGTRARVIADLAGRSGSEVVSLPGRDCDALFCDRGEPEVDRTNVIPANEGQGTGFAAAFDHRRRCALRSRQKIKRVLQIVYQGPTLLYRTSPSGLGTKTALEPHPSLGSRS